jgi:hypothetical protein
MDKVAGDRDKPLVAVIGYGILGIITNSFIDKAKYNIVVIDEINNELDVRFFREPSGPSGLLHMNSQARGYPGNTRVWGQQISLSIFDESSWSPKFLANLDKYSRILARIGFPRMTLQKCSKEHVTPLLINRALSSRFVGRDKLIGSSSSPEILRGLVNRITDKDGRFEIEYNNGNGIPILLESDYIFLCAGAINSLNLLVSSEIINVGNGVQYFDHPTIQLGIAKLSTPLIGFSRWARNPFIFGRKSTAFIIKENSGGFWTLRFFPRSTEYGSGISGKLRRILAIFGVHLFSEFSVQTSYDYEKDAPRAILSDDKKRVEYLTYLEGPPTVGQELTKVIEQTIKSIFNPKKVGWNYQSRTLNLTASAHYMGFLGKQSSQDKSKVDCNFRLTSNDRIYVPGSVSFPESVPGHPTYLAICTVLHAVEHLNSI